jgi:hypothetical protein
MKSLIAIILCLAAVPSYAQSCRGPYSLGETVPRACQYDRQAGVPAYQRWGRGLEATTNSPEGTTTSPVAEPTRPVARSIYNSSAYGFGR